MKNIKLFCGKGKTQELSNLSSYLEGGVEHQCAFWNARRMDSVHEMIQVKTGKPVENYMTVFQSGTRSNMDKICDCVHVGVDLTGM